MGVAVRAGELSLMWPREGKRSPKWSSIVAPGTPLLGELVVRDENLTSRRRPNGSS